MIRGLRNTQLPVLLVETGTYETAINVSSVASAITPQSFRKIETARILFEENIDANVVRAGISAPRSARMNPQLFLHSLIEKARSDRRRIVLPEGTEERILRAVDSLRRRNVVDLTLLGNEDEIRDRAAKLKVPLDGVEHEALVKRRVVFIPGSREIEPPAESGKLADIPDKLCGQLLKVPSVLKKQLKGA